MITTAKRAITATAVLALFAGGLFAGTLAPRLQQVLAGAAPTEIVSVIVQTARQADLHSLPATSTYDDKIAYLKATAHSVQQDLLAWLKTTPARDVTPFWLVSRVGVRARPDLIRKLAARTDVGMVWFNDSVRLEREPQASSIKPQAARTRIQGGRGARGQVKTLKSSNPRTLEPFLRAPSRSAPRDALDATLWNIDRVQADSCWAEGHTGAGVVVGNIDTGVEVTHPAFGGRWRETNGWIDAINGGDTPYDDNEFSHGTHAMGILTGGDGLGPYSHDIGVAPGATFICAKGFPASGGGPYWALTTCLEWMADPGRPDVLSNSWGGLPADTFFFGAIQRLRDLGIVVVFSAGNDGPAPRTIGDPGAFPVVTSVGSVYANELIVEYSSRGPAPDGWPFNEPHAWPRGDWDFICPSVVAPGYNILSSVRGDTFVAHEGTSMAGPHVAGCCALLRQKYPTLTQDQAFVMITANADPTPPAGHLPNNDYGWGRLNCRRALHALVPRDLPYIHLDSFSLADQGNHNDTLEPGEEGTIAVWVRNTGRITATGLRGVLRTSDPNFTVLDSAAGFGTLEVADTASNASQPFRLRAKPSCPFGYSASLPVVFESAESSWTRLITFTVGSGGTCLWGPRDIAGLPGDPYSGYQPGAAYCPLNNRLYVTCTGSFRIYIYSSDSLVQLLDSIAVPDSDFGCQDIAWSACDSTFWIIARLNWHTIYHIRPDGSVIGSARLATYGSSTGIAWDNDSRRLYCANGMFDTPSLIDIVDTLGNRLDSLLIPLGYVGGAKGLSLELTRGDPFAPGLVLAYECFNPGTGLPDSSGIYLLDRTNGQIIARFLVTPPSSDFHVHCVEYDPRDASYWVILWSRTAPYHKIAKYSGFFHVGIREQSSELGVRSSGVPVLRLWPNPSRGKLRIAVQPAGPKPRKVLFYDASGRLVKTTRFATGPSASVDLRNLAAGVYLVRLAGVASGTQKLVLQK